MRLGRTPEHVARIERAVRHALRRPEAIAWRRHWFPKSRRWDDGPCWHVARSIKRALGGGGEVIWLWWSSTEEMPRHSVYRLPGSRWCVDGHRSWTPRGKTFDDRICPRCPKHRQIAHRAKTGLLSRLIREELARA